MNTANIGRKPERVDEETGEILDPGPPPFEEVDPSDPTSFEWTPPRRPLTGSDIRNKYADAPAPSTAPRSDNRTLSLAYRDYGPDHRRLTARSVALELDAEFGDGFARMVGQEAV